jgi:serine-type D-Ala-D-Ala carboxypeptidase/endopeptidase (penicillin-binding protein 4)
LVRAAGSALYDAGGNNSFEPASTIKIVTAAAALDVLGPTTRYRTTVHASEPPVQGVVRGDLWLVGSGDPVLSTDEWASNFTREQPYTSLNRLAENLAAAGVRVIEGRVLGDDSRYDDQRYVEAWPSRFIGDGEIGPLSALTVNDGFATWGHPGRPFADPPMDAATIFKTLMQRNGIRVVGGTGSGRTRLGGVGGR